MDTHRSEEQEEASYSDDFEHDMESQDSPLSEEKVEIKVYKTAVGSLTVQPKKVSKNAPIVSDDNSKSARTLSELSLLTFKTKQPHAPATAGGNLNKCGNNNASGMTMNNRGGLAVKVNHTSKASINPLNNEDLRRPLAQEKVNPHDIPASVAASISTISISRLSLRNHTATATGFLRGTPNNIRRVVAHTELRKEKSYASAKYKTYHNPPLRGGNLPPLKAGLAKQNTNVAQRVASAKRMTIMDLKSKVKLLQDEIEKLKKENRFLNHLHHRQDNALRKWEGKDAELPRLLNQHKDEIRSLQEQLRRAQQHAREYNEKLSVRDKKILRLETELDKLKALVHEEHLQDRHTLQQDLDVTRMNLVGAEKRIREYMRHVEILEKNHKHQLAAQERKLIKVNTHTYELQQVVANLKLALRNKDRMLNYIQMRSSGRNLIRAFHAERVDRGDDMLYGTSSIQTELSRPYQPPPLPPLIKSHSFDFGNSRCSTPFLDDMKDYEIFSSSRRLSDNHRNSKKAKSLHIGRHSQEESNPKKKSARHTSRLSHSLESIPPSQSPRHKECGHRPVAPCSIKSHGKKDSKINSKSDSKVKSNFTSVRKSPRSIQHEAESKNSAKADNSSAKRPVQKDQKYQSGPTNLSNKNVKLHEKQMVSGKRNPPVNNVDSTELIYQGSTQGFKYEGPFVSNSKVDCMKDSTEILYSPKSDKLSERSLSSTCTSHTVTSSRSEDIISNIDILSARIRESCVLVPPPEDAFKSPRDHEDNKVRPELVAHNKTQNTVKPVIGPAGDNPVSPTQFNQAVLLTPIPSKGGSNMVAHENNLLSHQSGVLQQMHGADQDSVSSTGSHQSCVSPRMQFQSVSLPSVTVTSAQTQSGSSQFQLVQPTSGQTNFLSHVNNQAASSHAMHKQLSYVAANNYSQIIDNNVVQCTSPRTNHGYTNAQLVNVLPEPPHPLGLQREPQYLNTQKAQSVSPRLSQESPYFSFVTNPGIQEGMCSNNTNVTFYQASPQFNLQHSALTSPRATSLTHGPINSQQPILVSPSARSAFPRVGYIDSSQMSNSGEQSLPSINHNASNKNQSLYNPSYYVNLGSWK